MTSLPHTEGGCKPNTSGLNSVTLRFCPAGANDTLYYWDGTKWMSCSQQQYRNGCIEVSVTNSSDPNIFDLDTLVFALGHVSTRIPTLSEWGMIVLALLLAFSTIVVMRRRQPAT